MISYVWSDRRLYFLQVITSRLYLSVDVEASFFLRINYRNRSLIWGSRASRFEFLYSLSLAGSLQTVGNSFLSVFRYNLRLFLINWSFPDVSSLSTWLDFFKFLPNHNQLVNVSKCLETLDFLALFLCISYRFAVRQLALTKILMSSSLAWLSNMFRL